MGQIQSSFANSTASTSKRDILPKENEENTKSDDLCEELIVEIFTRLPPKSLIRSRSLSKSWYSCISSTRFIRMHNLRSAQILLFRHQLHYEAFSVEYLKTFRSDDFYTLHSQDQFPLCPARGYHGITPVQFPCSRSFVIVGSCNGIFCLREHQKGITLWNPSIRHTVSVPSCPRISGVPWKGLGFGFDHISDDFKIVWISYGSESSYIYAVKTGAWSTIAPPTPLISNVLKGPCFVNRALHWVVGRYHTESHDVDHPYILKFDLSTHSFGMIPMPEPFWTVTELTTFQGSLAVISTKDDSDSWIWVRKEDSWSVVFKSKANQFKGGVITGVLQRPTNGDLMLNTAIRGVHVYNLETGAQSRLVVFHAASFIFEIVQCVENLHLLDMESEANQLSVSV